MTGGQTGPATGETLHERLTTSPWETFSLALHGGRLAYQRCGGCGAAVFHPRLVCPHCGSTGLRWLTSGGEGAIYSLTVVRSRSGDHSVALIDLDEGFRMMSRIEETEGAPARIGGRVRARLVPGTGLDSLTFTTGGPDSRTDDGGPEERR